MGYAGSGFWIFVRAGAQPHKRRREDMVGGLPDELLALCGKKS